MLRGMKKLILMMVVASAFSVAGCKKSGSSAMWDKMGAYADKVCGCKDMD